MDKSLGKHELLKSTQTQVEKSKKTNQRKIETIIKNLPPKRHKIKVGLCMSSRKTLSNPFGT